MALGCGQRAAAEAPVALLSGEKQTPAVLQDELATPAQLHQYLSPDTADMALTVWGRDKVSVPLDASRQTMTGARSHPPT